VSQSPTKLVSAEEQSDYLNAFAELAKRVRNGASLSGRERNVAFLNTGKGSFADVSATLGFDLPNDGRGMALTDWDGDGDVDVWMSNRNAPRAQFLINGSERSDSDWISFQLEGDPAKNCPKDAAGSRVLIGKRSKTLHLGNGLLSQSSKWIHFGVKEESRSKPVTVAVQWAGGESEVFSDLKLGARYLLQQGKGARAVEARKAVVLEPKAQEIDPNIEAGRIRFSQPLKIPELRYRDFSGAEKSVNEAAKGSSVLLNLWATWCAPCEKELGDFGRAAKEFASAGIRTIVLNVDHLDPESSVDAGKARAFLQKNGYMGEGGMADAEMIETLDVLIRQAVYRHHKMPVPVSFLIDDGGWLCAVYKGTVEVPQIIKDRRNVGKSAEVDRDSALPYPGLWADKYFSRNPPAVAREHMEGGYLEDAQFVLNQFLQKNAVPPGDNSKPLEFAKNQQLAEVYFHCGEIAELEGRIDEAVVTFRKSLEYNQKQVPALNNLAWHLSTARNPLTRDAGEAMKWMQILMQAPGMKENPTVLSTLAAVFAANGRYDSAAQTTKRILQIMEGDTSEAAKKKSQTHQMRLRLYESGKALEL
jgi:thiol-disulfide isomerase/thioredoxin